MYPRGVALTPMNTGHIRRSLTAFRLHPGWATFICEIWPTSISSWLMCKDNSGLIVFVFSVTIYKDRFILLYNVLILLLSRGSIPSPPKWWKYLNQCHESYTLIYLYNMSKRTNCLAYRQLPNIMCKGTI